MALDCDIYDCEFDGAQFLSTATLQRRHMSAVEADNNEKINAPHYPFFEVSLTKGQQWGKRYHIITS